MRRRSQQGFTLVELMVVLSVSAVLVIAGLVCAGRYAVTETDAVRAAQSQGLIQPRVTERHNFRASSHGCADGDAVAFSLAAIDAHGAPVEATVCCGEWFRGCRVQR